MDYDEVYEYGGKALHSEKGEIGVGLGLRKLRIHDAITHRFFFFVHSSLIPFCYFLFSSSFDFGRILDAR